MFVYFFLLECVCIIHIENMLTYLNSDEKGTSGNQNSSHSSLLNMNLLASPGKKGELGLANFLFLLLRHLFHEQT